MSWYIYSEENLEDIFTIPDWCPLEDYKLINEKLIRKYIIQIINDTINGKIKNKKEYIDILTDKLLKENEKQ